MKQATSFGGLVKAKARVQLRRCGRLRGPEGVHAASCTTSQLRVLALGGALAVAALLVSTDAYGAPGPDPFRQKAAAPRAPAPDPHPSSGPASTQSSSPAPSPSPAPLAEPSGGSSGVVERQTVAPTRHEQAKPQRRRERQPQPAVPGPQPEATRAATPPAVETSKSTLNASAAVAAVSASSGRPLALGGLALLLLAIASGSLVALATRDHSWRPET